MHKFGLIFLVQLLTLPIFGQDDHYKVNSLNTEDGLSYRHITAITQDHQGFIWIGTRDGLNKFDGYDFTIYTDRASKDLPAITNNYVHDVEVDKNGHLWIGTESGLTVLRPEENTTTQYSPEKIFGKSSNIATVDAITITDQTKRIFIHSHTEKTFDKLYSTVEYQNGKFKRLQINYEGKEFKYFANVFEDPSGKLWVRPALHGTFFQLDDNFNILKAVRIPDQIDGIELKLAFPDRWQLPESKKYIQNQEFVRIKDQDLVLSGALCDGDSIRMIRVNLTKGTFDLIKDVTLGAERMPQYQFYDRDGNLWLSHEDEFRIFKNGKVQKVGSKEEYFPTGSTTCFFQSNDGTIWAGTHFGVIRAKKTTTPFQFALQSEPNNEGYGRSMRGISEPHKDWIYSGVVHDGLWAYNLKTGEEKHILTSKVQGDHKIHDILPYGLTVSNGQLWICNWFDDGILKLNLETNQLSHIQAKDNTSGFARCISVKDNGNIFLGTDQGLNIVYPKQDKVERYYPKSAPEAFEIFNIVVLAKSNHGKLWIGTQNRGLFLLNSNEEVKPVSLQPGAANTNTILSLLETKDNLWVGTSNGLIQYDLSSKKNRVFTERDGLPDTKIYAIESINQVLWITTDKGICRFDPIKETFINYGLQEGLPHEEFNFSSHQKLKNKTIVFGSMNGLVLVHPINNLVKKTAYPIILTKMEKFDEDEGRIRPFNISKGETIQIYPDDKFFSLHFAMLDLFSSESINYAYKLKGYQEKWIPLGTSNNIRFSKLPPGDYVLVVKAQGSNGLWNEKQLSVSIRVHEVFYKTWWFLSLMLLCFGAIVYGIIRYRNHQQHKIQLLRLKIASDLHDDVGGVLTQIGVQAEMIKEGIYDAPEEKIQIDNIAENSREAIRAMSDVLWSIDVREEKMHDLILRMKSYALEILSTREIDVHFEIDEMENKQLDLDFRQNVYLAFKEMINNIVKHSNATKVVISMSKKDVFSLKVSDNGTLSKPSFKKSGQGLRNLKLRAERIGGSVTIDSTNGYTIILIA
ncbi:MAG: hypothetical protein Crog4KO_16060 [Crocinitomicaceae bacterium]